MTLSRGEIWIKHNNIEQVPDVTDHFEFLYQYLCSVFQRELDSRKPELFKAHYMSVQHQ